jgi:hypothetical protein
MIGPVGGAPSTVGRQALVAIDGPAWFSRCLIKPSLNNMAAWMTSSKPWD